MFLKIKTLRKSFFISSVLIIILIFAIYYFFNKNYNNIAVIQINGPLYPSYQYNPDGSLDQSVAVSLDIVTQIRKADENKKVKAIVFTIDSGGGAIFTAEEITRAIKEVKKPTVALIRGKGMSSAYWIASATDRIFALPVSATVDIGVTNSYTDNSKQNESNGITFHKLSYGKYKDMMNNDKELTTEEEKIILEQTKKEADIFIKEVSGNRHLPIEKVEAIADGTTMLGQDAIKLGLIDEMGSFTEVEKYLSKILKTNVEIKILK